MAAACAWCCAAPVEEESDAGEPPRDCGGTARSDEAAGDGAASGDATSGCASTGYCSADEGDSAESSDEADGWRDMCPCCEASSLWHHAERGWSPERVHARRRRHGEELFLVSWLTEYVHEPDCEQARLRFDSDHRAWAWESMETLLGAGGAGVLAAFRRAEAARRQTARAARRQTARAAAAARKEEREAHTRSEEQRLLQEAIREDAELRNATRFDVFSEWPDLMDQVAAACPGHALVWVENICLAQVAARYLSVRSKETCEQVLFHCTSSRNLASILRHGLVVPGRLGVTVLNGSAHGVGIYTATQPQRSYARDYEHLHQGCFQFLCCMGTEKCSAHHSYRVFFDDDHILPCLLVTARQRCTVSGPPTPPPRPSLEIHSELPVKVHKEDGTPFIVYPKAKKILQQTQCAVAANVPKSFVPACVSQCVALPGRRVLYAARGDLDPESDGGPAAAEVIYAAAIVWYDREHKALTSRRLRAAPRAVKAVARAGLVPKPRRVGPRSAQQRLKESALRRRRRELAVEAGHFPQDE